MSSQPSPIQASQNTALYICSQEDHNLAFKTTEENFLTRVNHLKNSKFTTDIQTNLDIFQKVEEYIYTTYPNGLNYLYFRMHGSETICALSNAKGGVISINLNEDDLHIVRRICQAVRPGGIFIIEACRTGAGKNNFLKFLAELCHPGVVVMGSKVSDFEIEFDPNIPKHFRVISKHKETEGQDSTRIYYQTGSGKPTDIPVLKLNALQELLGTSPEKIDLCYRFLGEQKTSKAAACLRQECKEAVRSADPKTFSERLEIFKDTLRKIPVSAHSTGLSWQKLLYKFALYTHLPHSASIVIDLQYREGDLEIDPTGDIHGIIDSNDDKKRAYQFLLGAAILDDYREIFSWIDLNQKDSASGMIAQCIHALSNLAIHPDPNLSTLQTLEKFLKIIQESYQVTDEYASLCPFPLLQGLSLQDWSSVLVNQQQPCMAAYVDTLNCFMIRIKSELENLSDFDKKRLMFLAASQGFTCLTKLALSCGPIAEDLRAYFIQGAIIGNRIEIVRLLLNGPLDPCDYEMLIQASKKQGVKKIRQLLLSDRAFSKKLTELLYEASKNGDSNAALSLLNSSWISQKAITASYIYAKKNGHLKTSQMIKERFKKKSLFSLY